MNINNAVWGIDPGSTGALVSIRGEQHRDIIEIKFAKPNQPPHWFNVGKWINENVWPEACFIESVHAMPGDGKSTMFTFGKNVGIMHGILYGQQISFTEIVPDTWRRTFGLAGRKYTGTKSQQRSARKRDHLEVAKQIFPGVKLTQETCDAYLIAEHGWRVTFGKTTPEVKTELRAGTGILRSEIER